MKMNLYRTMVMWLMLAASGLLVGCGNSNPVCPSGASGCGCASASVACVQPEFLYATTLNQIMAFSVNPTTGRLNALAPVPGPSDGAGLRVSSGNSFLYVSDFTGNALDAFVIDASSGNLTPVTGSPFTAIPSPVGLVDNGKFLFVANEIWAEVSVFSIDGNGDLSEISASPFSSATGPWKPTVTPDGKFLYVSNFPGNISGYSIDPSTGSLTPVPGSPFFLAPSYAGAVGVQVHLSGKFLYAGYSDFVAGFTIDGTSGSLTPMNGSPFSDPGQLQDIAIDKSGNFLYASNAGLNNVDGFRIDQANGTLTPLASSPFPAGNSPMQMAVDDNRLYVTNNRSNDISGFNIDQSSGALTVLTGSPYPAGSQPIAIAIGH